MRWFWRHYLAREEQAASRAPPAAAKSLADLPPALVITAAAIRCATRRSLREAAARGGRIGDDDAVPGMFTASCG